MTVVDVCEECVIDVDVSVTVDVIDVLTVSVRVEDVAVTVVETGQPLPSIMGMHALLMCVQSENIIGTTVGVLK